MKVLNFVESLVVKVDLLIEFRRLVQLSSLAAYLEILLGHHDMAIVILFQFGVFLLHCAIIFVKSFGDATKATISDITVWRKVHFTGFAFVWIFGFLTDVWWLDGFDEVQRELEGLLGLHLTLVGSPELNGSHVRRILLVHLGILFSACWALLVENWVSFGLFNFLFWLYVLDSLSEDARREYLVVLAV